MKDQRTTQQTITPIIFAINASARMEGEQMQHVNNALSNILSKLDSYGQCPIEYAVLQFSSGAQWLTDGFIPLDIFSTIHRIA